MNRRESFPRHKDISVEKLVTGGVLLSCMYGGRLRRCRYFCFTVTQAKREFLAELKAGLI